ncbi:unnamed protein product, partial [Ixodes hexagonus]
SEEAPSPDPASPVVGPSLQPPSVGPTPPQSKEVVCMISKTSPGSVSPKPKKSNLKVHKRHHHKRKPCLVHGAQTHLKSHQRAESDKSDEDCSLATPLVWLAGCVQKLAQTCLLDADEE